MNKRKVKIYKKKIYSMLVLIIVLLIPFSVCTAYLTDQTSKQNTFTVGDIDIILSESDNLNLKMVPGKALKKDPKVTVINGSVSCYLFVSVEEENHLAQFVDYDLAEGWIPLSGFEGIFYRDISSIEEDQEFNILKNNEVYVKENVTKETLIALSEDSCPLLNFSAYAIQKDSINDPVGAWNILQNGYR